MKKIPLTQGKYALVDDEDFEKLIKHKWHLAKCYNTFYAKRGFRVKGNYKHSITQFMHRVILNTPSGFETDHIDGNGLNNQKSNLRITTRRTNGQNRHHNKTSSFLGVSWKPRQKRWAAQITINGRCRYLGIFKTEIEAHERYKKAIKDGGLS